MVKKLTPNQKRCEDCDFLKIVNGKLTCEECFGQMCEDIDDCPVGVTLEVLEEIDRKQKENKVKLGARSEKTEKKTQKERTVKVSDRKKHLFSNIKSFLDGYCSINGGKLTVEKENKLILVEIDGKIFKIDLIEQRPKK